MKILIAGQEKILKESTKKKVQLTIAVKTKQTEFRS